MVAQLYRRTPAEGKTELLKSQFSAGNEVDLDGVEDPAIVAHAFKRWVCLFVRVLCLAHSPLFVVGV